MEYRYLETTGALQDGIKPPPADRAGPAKKLASGQFGKSRTGTAGPGPDTLGRTMAVSIPQMIPDAVIEMLPETVARASVVLPARLYGETLEVYAADPHDIALRDKLTFLTGKAIILHGAPRQEVLDGINRCYSQNRRRPAMIAQRHAGLDDNLESDDDEDDASVFYEKTIEVSSPVLSSPTTRGLRAANPAAAHPRRLSVHDATPDIGADSMFYFVVEEGQKALQRDAWGRLTIITGPQRRWRWFRTFQRMQHYVAHPGEFLIVRFRDGRQEHLPGPSELWFDPRIHLQVDKQDGLQIAANEAVVVYSKAAAESRTTRRIEHGPQLFVPQPGEWLHTFSWHASQGGSQGVVKVPKGLVFQKLWLMPDQMYHDVPNVRTSNDAMLTIRLMIFFELQDISRMLDTTHDPIGDFVNAATADVVGFVSQHDFESFKQNTDQLNTLTTYRHLTARAGQCGYRINNVVYRGYGAPDSLQQMHDQAIEARTRLQLERATENQAQELENFKLESQMARAGKRRGEQSLEVRHELELQRQKAEAEMSQRSLEADFARRQDDLNSQLAEQTKHRELAQRETHLQRLKDMGVELTSYLTQARADQVIEVRGKGTPQLHFTPDKENP